MKSEKHFITNQEQDEITTIIISIYTRGLMITVS